MSQGRRAGRTTWWGRAILGQAALFALGVLVYRLGAHRLVEAAYEGRSVEFLNGLLEGRTSVPLGLYLALVDALVVKVVAAGLLVLLVQVVLDAGRRGRRGSVGTAGGDRVAGTPPVTDPLTPAKPAPLTPAKRVLFTAVVLLIPALFVTLPYVWRYRAYMAQIEVPPGLFEGTYEAPSMPLLSAEELVQIGKGHKEAAPPNRSYLVHAAEKPAGTVRIGIFGGSVALGEEAALPHDLSTHLQHRLEAAGVGPVEVINFGVSGFGVTQMVKLWEYVGRDYDLDFVVMMPFYFHISRDNSFLHTSHHYGPLNGVFALDGDSVRYVPVVGTDRLDSCRRYFSPLQPPDYWRYDTRVPMAFRPLLPNPLDRGGNPFYYAADAREATLEMYRRVFRAVSREVGHLVLFTDTRLLPHLTALRADGVTVLASQLDEFREESSSLYRAPFDHPSGLGYEVFAAELAALFLQEDRPYYRRLRVARTPELPAAGEEIAALGGLAALRDVRLSLAGATVGEFRRRKDGEGRWGRLAVPVDFAEDGIVSLAVPTPGRGFPSAHGDASSGAPPSDPPRVFLPLPFALRTGDEVAVVWEDGDTTVRVPIGAVRAAAGPLGILEIDWTRLAGAHGGRYHGWIDEGGEFGVVELATAGRVRDLRLVIGDEIALLGTTVEHGGGKVATALGRLLLGETWVRTTTRLEPRVAGYLYYRGCEGQYVAVDHLVLAGQFVDLTFRDARGDVHTVPFLRYEVISAAGTPFEPPFPPSLERDPSPGPARR